MKKSLLGLFVLFVVLTTFSCDLFWDIVFGETGTGNGTGNGNFWARDLRTDDETPYRITASLMASNDLCEIWVENGQNISQGLAQEIADEYKLQIYPKIMRYFGWITDWESVADDNKYIALSFPDDGFIPDEYICTIDLANAITGRDKLTILLLDIRDGFTPSNGSYIAGYFDSRDMLGRPDSNYRAMLYMDTYPAMAFNSFTGVSREKSYETLAHELQHLMNFTTRVFNSMFKDVDGDWAIKGDDFNFSDTWLDEGLSAMAEWVYSGVVSQRRIEYYNADETGYIARGDNFFSWDNHFDRNIPATYNTNLNDYATVCIFFHWLRLHYDGILQEISRSKNYDYQAISELYYPSVVGGALATTEFDNLTKWNLLLVQWYAANYFNLPSTIYGYKDAPILKDIKVSAVRDKHVNSGSATTWHLYPGEAVFSYSGAGMNRPVSNDYVWYYCFGNGSINDVSVPAGGSLFSLNRSIYIRRFINDLAVQTTSVIVTGQSHPSFTPNSNVSIGRSAMLSEEIFAIGAGEMIRRNGSGQGRQGITIPSTVQIQEIRNTVEMAK
ncbi:MAG: hypothetical protein FWC01_08480 [Treponema sp.]|nr:hypothetical protein [Treponema sp.]MCL2237964.1 hypothetical protein [Treponema sp.]